MESTDGLDCSTRLRRSGKRSWTPRWRGLHLIGRGVVESTFDVVAAFMGANMLVVLLPVWGVFVGFVRVVAGLDD